jgi:anti-sigma regulatory factor (Ser/Thr protein kinase)
MITMAPPRPSQPPPRQTEVHGCQVRLPAEPATAGEARDHVRAVLAAWDVPVDPDIAVLLASDLVTNAILHQVDGTITLVLTSSPGQLRVDVYGTPVHLPPRGPLPYEAVTGRGLALVTTLADQWGWYITPMGRAVYFTLEFPLQP